MTYICTNIRGDLNKFLALLDKISFTADDVMFIAGDTLDYHDDSAELLCDLSMRENVYPVRGPREARALELLSGFNEMLASGDSPDDEYSSRVREWMADGGQPTFDGFRAFDADMREGIVDYLSDFAPYEEAFYGDDDYTIVHSGIRGFDPLRTLDEYENDDFTSSNENLSEQAYFDDRYVVIARRDGGGDKIFRHGKTIVMDATRSGKIACLCIDTGDEIYV